MTLASLVGGLNFIASIHMVAPKLCLIPVPGDLTTSSGLQGPCIHVGLIHICRQDTPIHSIKNK